MVYTKYKSINDIHIPEDTGEGPLILNIGPCHTAHCFFPPFVHG